MIRIGSISPKSHEGLATVRRQYICENGKWIYAVFQFDNRTMGTWIRIR